MIAPRTPAEKKRYQAALDQIERRRNATPIVRPTPRADGLSINPALMLPDLPEAFTVALRRLDEFVARATTLRAEIASKGEQIATATPKDEQRLVKEIATARAALADLPDLAYFAYQHAASEWYAVVRSSVSIAAARLAEGEPECITATQALAKEWDDLQADNQAARDYPNASTLRAENDAKMAALAHQIDARRAERDQYFRTQNKLKMVEQIADLASQRLLGIRLDQAHKLNVAARKYAQAQIKRVFN